MKIQDVMNRHVEFASPDEPVTELAVTMGDLDVGSLPIGTPEDPKGVVTDRDILYRVVARGLDASQVRACDVMSSPLISCRAEDSFQTAMDMMTAHRVRRLAVTQGGGGAVVGWVTLADLARTLLLESGTVQSAVREITRETAG
ncbi:CBS domain-containing protein [Aureimonas flava]|uniref:CBS domain-containing protein n=1 Tax=Aureimonas flava TaxID=2320271 RepID=A0A3A1WHY2_9HYPH|nr:CBS domain-containing protein [Aureimonas flava]RIX99639.1 CBS domain-containing protein [Aureimonas flava]